MSREEADAILREWEAITDPAERQRRVLEVIQNPSYEPFLNTVEIDAGLAARLYALLPGATPTTTAGDTGKTRGFTTEQEARDYARKIGRTNLVPVWSSRDTAFFLEEPEEPEAPATPTFTGKEVYPSAGLAIMALNQRIPGSVVTDPQTRNYTFPGDWIIQQQTNGSGYVILPQPPKPQQEPAFTPSLVEFGGQQFLQTGPNDYTRIPAPTLDELGGQALVEGDYPRAQQLWSFANQPTPQQTLQMFEQALDYARSPADAFTISAI